MRRQAVDAININHQHNSCRLVSDNFTNVQTLCSPLGERDSRGLLILSLLQCASPHHHRPHPPPLPGSQLKPRWVGEWTNEEDSPMGTGLKKVDFSPCLRLCFKMSLSGWKETLLKESFSFRKFASNLLRCLSLPIALRAEHLFPKKLTALSHYYLWQGVTW